MLTSAKVEVEVEAELGNICCNIVGVFISSNVLNTHRKFFWVSQKLFTQSLTDALHRFLF